MQVYDTELILSWTPNEYDAFINGAMYRTIDEYERMADEAMFYRQANNAKRITSKKLFDADKARKRLDKGDKRWKESKDVSAQRKQYRQMKEALKGFTPVFSERR